MKKIDDIKKCIFNNTISQYPHGISLIFFDVTTLHLETISEDDLRKFGFSKNCQFNTTQLVLALATTGDGLPIGYKLFPGNTAETKTLLNSLEEWRKIIPIEKTMIIGDSAMMNKENIRQIEEAGLEYIIAFPLKKASKDIKEKFLDDDYLPKVIDNEFYWAKEVPIENKRIIATYSTKRHKKDLSDRNRAIERIKKRLEKNNSAKKLISNKSYLKYTNIDGKDIAIINEEKILAEAKWDGMHGLITNSKMPIPNILQRYRFLWVIEESFRINKTDLKMRPIYHRKPARIAAHIAICFIVYSIMRTLQFYLKKQNINLSVHSIMESLKNTQEVIFKDNITGERYRAPANMPKEAEQIYDALGIKRKISLISKHGAGC